MRTPQVDYIHAGRLFSRGELWSTLTIHDDHTKRFCDLRLLTGVIVCNQSYILFEAGPHIFLIGVTERMINGVEVSMVVHRQKFKKIRKINALRYQDK